MELLSIYWIDYKEGQRKFKIIDSTKKIYVETSWKITRNTAIVICKIAFNYFAFCCLQNKRESILYSDNFQKIRNFIRQDSSIDKKEIIVEISNEPITWHEKVSNQRLNGHVIAFFEEEGNIFTRVSFLGCKTYKILLWTADNEFQKEDFGCWHFFCPFDKSIHQLTSNSAAWDLAFNKNLYDSFGLFKKNN